MKKIAISLILFFNLFIFSHSIANQKQSVFITYVNNQPAETIAKELTEFYPPPIKILGIKDKLWVKASLTQWQTIKKIIKKLDKPSPMLLITLRQGGADLPGNPNTKIIQTDSRHYAGAKQSIRVQSGSTAELSLREAIPVLDRNSGEDGVGLRYQSVNTQFKIKPTLRNQKVSIKIHRLSENFKSNGSRGINGEGFQTQLTIPLGQWVNIASSPTQFQSKSIKTYSTQRRETPFAPVYIRVDQVR